VGPESGEDSAIESALLWHRPSTAYDFGCGAGHFAHALAAAGVTVDGFEVDPVKSAFFEFRAEASGLRAYMRLGQLRGSYDMVLALNVLDHLEEPVSAIAMLTPLVAPGKVLCTLAAFPKDGWHQSDVDIVASCGKALWADFSLSSYRGELVPWMDCWVRHAGLAVEPSLGAVPRLNPGTHYHKDAQGQVIFHANRFYSTPIVVDSSTAEICCQFNGESLGVIAESTDTDLEDLIGLCRYLQLTGHLYWEHPAISGKVSGVHIEPPHPLIPRPDSQPSSGVRE
jgi:SAM-dependent methyltransferase